MGPAGQPAGRHRFDIMKTGRADRDRPSGFSRTASSKRGRVRKIEKEGKMKAIVSITIDNEFVVHDIKVIEGEKGLFIAMPSRKAADGEYRDIAHPINSGTRDMIQSVILEKYATAALEEQQEELA